MSQLPATIPKQPALKPAEDYYRLRREGIGFIEQTGSRLWTDYNTHDPGITILEALIYALTDLAYRTGWDIKDILSLPPAETDPHQPFPNQPFFTARNILTVNPWTPEDFRRLLIDLDLVRNAWVFCKTCACDLHYYAWCEEGELTLGYQEPIDPLLQPKKVEPHGLYEVLLELESDPESGDLNDRKIEHRFNIIDPDGKPHPVKMELRFPQWGLEKGEEWQLFLASGAFTDLKVSSLGATKTYNVLTDNDLDQAGKDKYLREHWPLVFYVGFEKDNGTITIEHAALRLFGDSFVKSKTTVASLKAVLEDQTATGFIQRYRHKVLKVEKAVTDAKKALQQHRNLDEDYCRVQVVDVEDVAVCADVEIKPDADIERVQAKIWFEIEQYFNPPVPFYSLQELLDAGVPVEDIFNGPQLNSGFIKTGELAAAGLKTMLRTSEIINRLMDIEGVVAVNNLLLSKYDSEGNVIEGAADPTWVNDTPLFDPEKTSASWLLLVTQMRQPRLYHNQSRFLFHKNGLPFLPRMDEAFDTLTQLRGEGERPKIKDAPNDLPIPAGTYRYPEDYYPVQYSFPLTYGIGPHGLPSHVSAARRAQARQLKAFLMVFEQILGNALAQVAATAKLFSLETTVKRTYFVREFSEALIQGYGEITAGLNLSALEAMTETLPEFHERRNRFLNHIMARFGEQFDEYTLLLTDLQGQQVALPRLIEDKITFLNNYPSISYGRGRAFNSTGDLCSPHNIPCLKKRISLLLGYPDLAFCWTVVSPASGQYEVTFQLKDRNAAVWMAGNLSIIAASPDKVTLKAFRKITGQMIHSEAYEISRENGKFRLELKDENGNLLGRSQELFQTSGAALALKEELWGWSSNERAMVVEHLLLRPKFPGDALYPACVEGVCQTCGDEDPYSFRLTFVMPGWTAPFNTNLAMRGFAERTIRQEIPSHLLGKICWVSNEDGFLEDLCAPAIIDLVEILETRGRTAADVRPSRDEACDCALLLYAHFSSFFEDWFKGRTLVYIHPDILKAELETKFAQLDFAGISCPVVLDATLRAGIQALMVKHFHHLAICGWQFERFENAWCKWLEANALFDWTEERLQERVEAMLAGNFVPKNDADSLTEAELCKCAADLVNTYGMAFYYWMRAKIKAGQAWDDTSGFPAANVSLCPGFTFKEGTAASIKKLLEDRYAAYQEVSYRLWIVVHLLSGLSNTYPVATLHDCDEGSDQNPVRLGKTALGSF